MTAQPKHIQIRNQGLHQAVRAVSGPIGRGKNIRLIAAPAGSEAFT